MSQTVEFAFAIGQPVTVKMGGAKGKVTALFLDQSGKPQMRVDYADNTGGIHADYFYEHEIE